MKKIFSRISKGRRQKSPKGEGLRPHHDNSTPSSSGSESAPESSTSGGSDAPLYDAPLISGWEHVSHPINPRDRRASSTSSMESSSPQAKSSSGVSKEEIIRSSRTVLTVVEKALDGVPVPGAKAVFGAVSEALKNLQLAWENQGTAGDLLDDITRLIDCIVTPNESINSRTTFMPTVLRDLSSLKRKFLNYRESAIAQMDKSQLRQVLDAEGIKSLLAELQRKVSLGLSELQVRAILRVELKMGSLNNLALLDKLEPVRSAMHDAYGHPNPCWTGTRTPLLRSIRNWFEEDITSSSKLVYWLNGVAGTGKTTIAQSVAEACAGKEQLLASFFFTRKDLARRDASSVIPTLAYQFALWSGGRYASQICDAIAEMPDIRHKTVELQATRLLPVLDPPHPRPVLLIVLDALDECDQTNGREGGDLIPILTRWLTPSLRIKLLITSRTERSIVHMFNRSDLGGSTTTVALHQDIEDHVVGGDIEKFLTGSFIKLATDRSIPMPFPLEHELRELISRSGRLFIYAATILRWVSDADDDPGLRVQQVLAQDSGGNAYQHQELDAIYSHIIQKASVTSGDPIHHIQGLHDLLSTIVILHEEQRKQSVAALSGSGLVTDTLLSRLSAVLFIDPEDFVRLAHHSFSDFLLSSSRCTDDLIRIDVYESHQRLSLHCLQIMNATLVENLCKLPHPALPNMEILDLDEMLASHISAELSYACRFWLLHLMQSKHLNVVTAELLATFCQSHLFHWLEALSLLGHLLVARQHLPLLISWLRSGNCAELESIIDLLDDTRRMVEMNWLPIVSNALHVYHSATVNLPYCSLLERYQSKTHTYPYLVFGRRTSWGSTCRIVEGNDGSVDALAISPDGDILCSGSSVGTIRVWSAATGALRMVLHGHDDSAITAVSFSSDSSRLVSSSWDRSLVVWGAENGELVLTVAEAHRLPVTSVAYSPTQDAIASGSWDGNIHVWDSLNGRLLSSMEIDDWDSFKIHSIAFSNDGCYIASACSDNNVRLWNMVADDEPQVLMGHQQACTSVAWSQDGLILISGSEDGTVLAWDMTQARHDCVAVHIGSHTSPVTSVAVSSDSSWVAFGSLDNTLRLVQIKSGNLTATFEGHQGPINSVKFSHSNAEVLSGSEDGTMRIWDVLDGSYRTSDEDASVDMDAHTLALERKHTTTPSSPVQSLSFSHDGSRIAAGFDDGSIHVWDVASETRVVQLYLDAPVDSLALSPFGTQLGAVDSDENFTLWNIEDGNIVARLDTPIMGIAFSPVSPDIALCLGNRTVEVWQATDTPGMERIRTYNATRDWVVAVAFSSTGTYLASASHKGTLRVWSTSTSALLFKWKHLRPNIDIFSVSVQFIHDRALLLTDRSGKTNMMVLEGTPTRPHTVEDRDHLVPDLVVDDADEGLNQIERYYPPTGQGWVMYKMKLEDDGRRVCWLPPERRAGAFAQHGHLFATGAEGGTVTIIDFSRLSHV